MGAEVASVRRGAEEPGLAFAKIPLLPILAGSALLSNETVPARASLNN